MVVKFGGVLSCVKLILSIVAKTSIGNLKMIVSKRGAMFMFQVKRWEGMFQVAMPFLLGDWMVRDEIVSILYALFQIPKTLAASGKFLR